MPKNNRPNPADYVAAAQDNLRLAVENREHCQTELATTKAAVRGLTTRLRTGDATATAEDLAAAESAVRRASLLLQAAEDKVSDSQVALSAARAAADPSVAEVVAALLPDVLHKALTIRVPATVATGEPEVPTNVPAAIVWQVEESTTDLVRGYVSGWAFVRIYLPPGTIVDPQRIRAAFTPPHLSVMVRQTKETEDAVVVTLHVTVAYGVIAGPPVMLERLPGNVASSLAADVEARVKAAGVPRVKVEAGKPTENSNGDTVTRRAVLTVDAGSPSMSSQETTQRLAHALAALRGGHSPLGKVTEVEMGNTSVGEKGWVTRPVTLTAVSRVPDEDAAAA